MDYKRVPFDRALSFLSERVVLPSQTWEEQQGEIQNWAFTIAGITKATLLQEIQDRTTRAIADGDSFEQFKADFEEIMVKAGMSPLAPWRMRLIMLQNMRHSYNAGRYEEQTDPETVQRRPWALYKHDHPITPRPHHKVLDGFLARINDPIWQTLYPQSGFNCRCKVRTLSDIQVEAQGLTPSKSLQRDGSGQPVVDVDGKLVRPVEPGFEYAPGSNESGHRTQVLTSAVRKMSPELRREFMQALGDRLPRPGAPITPVALPEPKPEIPKRDNKPKRERFQMPSNQDEWSIWDLEREIAHREFEEREQSWDGAPDWIRKVVSRMAPPGSIDPDQFEDSIEKGCYHVSGDIHMDGFTPSHRASAAVWRHEYGHYIDSRLGRRDAHKKGDRFRNLTTDMISSRDKRASKAMDKDDARLRAMKNDTRTVRQQSIIKYLKTQLNDQGYVKEEILDTLGAGINTGPRLKPLDAIKGLSDHQLRLAHESVWLRTRRDRNIEGLINRAPKVWRVIYEEYKAEQKRGSTRLGLYTDFLAAMEARDLEYLADILPEIDVRWAQNVNDLIGSITVNGVGKGHATDYYRVPGMIGTETFANVLSIAAEADIGEEMVRYLSPATLKWTKSVLNEFIKSGDMIFDGYPDPANPPKVFSDD